MAAVHFHAEIEKAEAEDVSREEMTLPDPSISCVATATWGPTTLATPAGVMRYLGVKVEQGGVSESVLIRED